MDFQKIIDSNKDELQFLVRVSNKLKDIQNNSCTQFVKMLNDKKMFDNKELTFQFLCCLNSIANARPRQLSYYCRIIKLVKPYIKDKFTSDELAIIFSNKRIILLLLKEKLIDIKTIINFFVDSSDTLKFFCEELQKGDKNWFETQKSFYPEIADFLKNFKKETHQQFREEGQNHDLFARTIRKDDAIRLQELVSLNNHSFNLPLNSSPYDCLNDSVKTAKSIEYAALFGSISSFRYLWMCGAADSSPNLLKFAIAGGDYDIIHITEGKKYEYDEDCLKEAIRSHRNEIVHYIIDSVGVKFTIGALFETIRSFNFEIFIEYASEVFKDVNEKIDPGISALHVASQHGNLEVVKLLVKIPEIKPNIRDQYGRTPLHLASRAGFMSIVKYLVKYTKVNIEAKDKLGNVPLHLASLFCRLEIVKFLSTLNRVDANITDRVFFIQ